MRTHRLIRGLALGIALSAAIGISAQNSAPAPGAGGSFNPAPANGIGWNPGPMAPPPGNWGGPWGNGWGATPSIIVNLPTVNSGVKNVVACGYDAQGNWRTIPLTVSYAWNGAQYNVEVLNAWNPWTDMWNKGVDANAYNTSYYLNGTEFDFYTVLSTGTYYFNL
ncbi:MAG: hypothetical protein NC097_06300 [Clostridium sp.]|nr:hypothetical protein [Prevotella sp.]MCM1429390.1 hypothetical protein [Clostridium sp.]MCM1475575.1 hypothetical protein [Muribaculaceae bacterium]